MKLRRLISCGLAACILLNSAPPLVRTAYAAEPTSATLSFPGGARSSDVVVGGSATIDIVTPSYYRDDTNVDPATGGSKNGLNISSSVTNFNKSALTILPSGTTSKTITVGDTFFPVGDTTGKVTLDIEGAYYALLSSGTVIETGVKHTSGGSSTPTAPLSSTFKLEGGQELTAYQSSSITIECTKSETADQAPNFKIKTKQVGGNPVFDTTGDAFSTFDTVYTKSSPGRNPVNTPLVVSLGKAGGTLYNFSIETRTVYTTDAAGNPLTPSNRYVQEGATFRLEVPQPTSNKVFLTVHSAKNACEEVAAMVVTQAQPSYTGEQQFIKLAEGEDIGFIRQDFMVNYDTTLYNAAFYLKWSWVPMKDDGTGNLIEDTDPAKKAILTFPDAAGSFQAVKVNPLYDDVKGKLVAEVRYKDRDGTPLAWATVTPVTIKGLGTPATVTRFSHKTMEVKDNGTHQEKTTTFTGDSAVINPGTTLYMNAYDGHLVGPPVPKEPYQYTLQLNMGLGSSSSAYAVVECLSGSGDIVSLQTLTQQGSTEVLDNYAFGGQIKNPNQGANTEGKVKLVITPQKTGKRDYESIKVQVTYYVLNAQGRPVKAVNQPPQIAIAVKDTSPDSDAKLKTLVLKGKVPEGVFGTYTWKEILPEQGYTFTPENIQYQVTLPYKYEEIQLTPTRNSSYASETIFVKATLDGAPVNGDWVLDSGGFPPGYETGGYLTVASGRPTKAIPLEPNKQVKVEIVVVAEDQSTKAYTVMVMRNPQGTDATLKSLTLTDKDGNVLFNNIVKNQFSYEVQVPFKVQLAKVAYELNDPNAPELKPDKWIANDAQSGSFDPGLVKEPGSIFSKQEWLEIAEECKKQHPESSREMNFTIHTKAEDGVSENSYNLHITRAEPSEVNTLASLQILNAKDGDKVLPFTPAFHADMGEEDFYELAIPYKTDKIKVSAKPSDTGATVLLIHGGTETELGHNTPSKSFSPQIYTENADGTTTYYDVLVEVWPESTPPGSVDRASQTYKDKVMRYPIHVYRDPPSKENLLKSLTITDQDDGAVNFPDFDPEVMNYSISVPYEVTKVRVTPTAMDENVSKIEVNGRKVGNGSPSNLITLGDAGAPTAVRVVVTPEDTAAPTAVYTLTITRQPPSSDARLVKLEVADATDFSPVFAPSRTSYTAKVAKDAEGVKITPTANHAGARIEIDGVRVESGKQSDLIRILTETWPVNIVVTAQDGVTKMTYKIEFTNENLIQKTSNADLKKLEVEPGVMRPVDFSPAVTDYAISVEEEAYAVELFPVPADKYATMKVFQDSREIGDYSGNYAASIQDGENEFTIEVTAPDESQKKTYTVLVYRNEEDEMGVLNPVTADQIDWKNTSDIIVVDIHKYARIAADVFETLQDYPEKTIIFQGNDYSFQFRSKDLDEVIPHTAVYDLGMKFSSPYEDEIYDEIYSHSGNRDTDFVFVHFGYHGDLPGKAVLSLSLGQQYKNELLHWNYYNEERQRIDFYGSVKTNTRGTFTLTMDHLSTYIISDQRIVGAENKSGGLIGDIYNPDGSVRPSGVLNPDTGTEGRP